MTREQIENLKRGDEVAWQAQGRWRITRVEKVLSTQITTKDGRRWTKKAGREFGGPTYGASYLAEATEERKALARDAVEHERLSTKLRATKWDERDLATLRRVVEALEGAAGG